MITPELKKLRLEREMHHIMQDMLIRGTFYYEHLHQGCSVGCSARDIDPSFDIEWGDVHKIVADFYGTPVWLEQVRDHLFECVTEERKEMLHIGLTINLPANVCLDGLMWDFTDAILADFTHRLEDIDEKTGTTHEIFNHLLFILRNVLRGPGQPHAATVASLHAALKSQDLSHELAGQAVCFVAGLAEIIGEPEDPAIMFPSLIGETFSEEEDCDRLEIILIRTMRSLRVDHAPA